LIFLGGVLADQGLLSEADRCFLQATECAEGCIEEAFYNLGMIRLGEERYANAVKYLRKALRIDPVYREAKLALRDARLALRYRKREKLR
jgi:tetratricopeptide (TPR) repeat protein